MSLTSALWWAPDVLRAALEGSREEVIFPASIDSSIQCPLFVTIHTLRRDGSLALRGCIGTLSPTRITSLKDYTHSSAFRDRRFSPIELAELPSLQIGISLLVRYEKADNALDWEVGTHGIMIKFRDSSGREYSATYLPEVAKEQGWDQVTTLRSLVRKAGFNGSISDQQLREISTTRYQSSKATVTFDEYSTSVRH